MNQGYGKLGNKGQVCEKLTHYTTTMIRIKILVT